MTPNSSPGDDRSTSLTPEKYEQVRELFLRICELSEVEREGELAKAARENAEIHAEVVSLLEHVDAPAALLDGAAGGKLVGWTAALESSEGSLPSHLGKYRVESRIGAGGMGIVFEASEEDPPRRVALKVIKPGVVSEQTLLRFGLEARLLARVQHPGIAQIYEAGTLADELVDRSDPAALRFLGLPYIAMEFVDGVSITAWEDYSSLSDRLLTFCKVCDAVHHAHARGVIHRDLKPENILINDRGEPRVLDFGIARVTDEGLRESSLRTLSGLLLGTLPYMSPEQLAVDSRGVDTRSDVYSLGVVLFELLSSQLPYDLDGQRLHQAMLSVRDADPRRLGSLCTEYRGDLDTIVSKALERDPDNRYQSALAFAEDIQRFLRREPIAARPRSTVYQLKKFAERNRAVAVGLTLMLLGVVVGLVGTAWGLIRSNTAVERLEEESKVADAALESRRVESEKRRQMVKFLESVILAPVPHKARIAGGARVRDVLDQASKKIESQFAGDQELRAWAHYRVGKSYVMLGEYKRAEPHLVSAIEDYTATVGLEHLETISAENHLAYALVRSGESVRAEGIARATFQRSFAAYGAREPQTLSALTHLAASLRNQSRYDESAVLDERNLQLCRDVFGEAHRRTFSAYHNVGVALSDQGKNADATPYFRASYEGCAKHLGKDHPQTLSAIAGLADNLTSVGENDEATALYEEALAGQKRVNGLRHPETLVTMSEFAIHCRRTGRLERSRRLGEQTLEIRRSLLGENHPATLKSMNNLSVTLMDLKENDAALDLLDRYLAKLRKIAPDGNRNTINGLNNRGTLLFELKRHDEAHDHFEKVLVLAKKLIPPKHWHQAVMRFNYARNLNALGRTDEAEPLLLECHREFAERLGPKHRRTVRSREVLHDLYRDAGRLDEAAKFSPESAADSR